MPTQHKIIKAEVNHKGMISIDPLLLKEFGIEQGKVTCIYNGQELIVLPKRRSGKLLVENLLKRYTKRGVSLPVVRKALSTIKDSLSETIIEERRDR